MQWRSLWNRLNNSREQYARVDVCKMSKSISLAMRFSRVRVVKTLKWDRDASKLTLITRLRSKLNMIRVQWALFTHFMKFVKSSCYKQWWDKCKPGWDFTKKRQSHFIMFRWAKNKSHQSREVLKMLILKFNDQTSETFDEKAEMFKEVFFSTSSSTKLDDIPGAIYPRLIECLSSIIEQEVLKTIKRTALDKTSGPDEIINWLLKTCVSIMISLLISLFAACI